MINYRAEALNRLLANLKSAGTLPTDSVKKASYGNFVHLMDPEGNKLNYRSLMMWNMPNWVN